MGDEPVFFPGDLSDRGSPLETALVARMTEIGKPFVFVTGNHDSDRSAQELATKPRYAMHRLSSIAA